MFLKEVNSIFVACQNDGKHFEILSLNNKVNELFFTKAMLHNTDILYYYSDI